MLVLGLEMSVLVMLVLQCFRVVSPIVEGGYVLDGGALCLELLTPNVSYIVSPFSLSTSLFHLM